MAAAKAKAKGRAALYAVKEGKAALQRKSCPRCGTGVLLAEHENRLCCGKCSYTEFKK
ncbi:MAG: 30S ribosomal protein S27ae [Methanomicrobiales archaeon]|nr:30S ribosomal protein S27ae [Methanomicrobiales archaeon]